MTNGKTPLSTADVAAIRAKLALGTRDRALFEIAVSSCLRASDVVALRVSDVIDDSGRVLDLGRVTMRKTRRPVVFDISGAARAALRAYLDVAKLSANAPLFPRADNAKGDAVQAISTEAYRRKVHVWADVAGHRDTSAFGTHSLRKTRPALIYAAEKDVAVCSRLLGHTDTKATLTYLGIDTQAAIAVARRYEV